MPKEECAVAWETGSSHRKVSVWDVTERGVDGDFLKSLFSHGLGLGALLYFQRFPVRRRYEFPNEEAMCCMRLRLRLVFFLQGVEDLSSSNSRHPSNVGVD